MSKVKPTPVRTTRRPVLPSDSANGHAEFYRLLAQVDPHALQSQPPDLPPDHPARVMIERTPKGEVGALANATADHLQTLTPDSSPTSQSSLSVLQRHKQRTAIYERKAIAAWWLSALISRDTTELPNEAQPLNVLAGLTPASLAWACHSGEFDPPKRLESLTLTRSTLTAAPPRHPQSRDVVGRSLCAA